MRSGNDLLRCSLVGLALILSGSLGAAGLDCISLESGFRCEAWPQGSDYRYEWHIAGARTGQPFSTGALHEVGCFADHASAIAVSVITPAGHIETATRLLPACHELHTDALSARGGTSQSF
ncbi:hypothetical protein [Tahibacter harae]|uniref:Uncharacterized protein n=1 Tax=Tahibacter harae TaxID=2963937 RepID=A0ABT1QX11_9GAMM|nr:hypothetical protein [Tahibacter harae]MCQ4166830.1 hypothetical protein [Tahibacter harae]